MIGKTTSKTEKKSGKPAKAAPKKAEAKKAEPAKKAESASAKATADKAPKKIAAPAKEFAAKAPTLKDYGVIIRPVVTEKATLVSQHGQVVFQVSMTASKSDIRDAVQSLFKVQVTGVNTSIRKGKTKIFRGRKAMRSDTKIAYVTLAEGQNIDVAAGV